MADTSSYEPCTLDFEMLFKSLGCNASSLSAWISLPMIFDGLTLVFCCFLFGSISDVVPLCFLLILWVTVEHSASALSRALHGGLDLYCGPPVISFSAQMSTRGFHFFRSNILCPCAGGLLLSEEPYLRV